MIKLEIFLQREGDFRFAIKKFQTSKKRKISLICENTPYFESGGVHMIGSLFSPEKCFKNFRHS
jgi:hypothetical protein